MGQNTVPGNLHKTHKNPSEQMSSTEKSNSGKFGYMEGGFFMHSGVQGLVPFLSRIREKVRHFLEGTRASEMFDICCELVEESYILKFLLLSIVINCILPIFVFIVFAVLSLITTFTGFLLIEGVLLIFAACAALLWFGAVGILFTLTAGIIILIYLIYRHAGNIAYKIETFYFPPSADSVDDDMVVVDTDHED